MNALRCERCGYALEGVDEDGVCPECGRPVRENHLDARPGTPSQQSVGIRSYFRTLYLMVFSPRELFLQMRFVGSRSESPALSVIAFSVILCWCLMVFTALYKAPSFVYLLGFALFMILVGLVIWWGICVLNMIMCGVVLIVADLFGVDRPHRFSFIVGGHAAIAWLLTGLIWVGGYIAAEMYRMSQNTQTEYASRQVYAVLMRDYYGPAFWGGLLLGSLLFVYFMWQGYCHTRFLNPELTGEGEA